MNLYEQLFGNLYSVQLVEKNNKTYTVLTDVQRTCAISHLEVQGLIKELQKTLKVFTQDDLDAITEKNLIERFGYEAAEQFIPVKNKKL